MNALNQAIKNALTTAGETTAANKAYLEFIKANFIVPIEKRTEEEQPHVLFLEENDGVFLPVFTQMHYLDDWASEIKHAIQILKLSGVDLLKGLADNVTVCLDPGSTHYKAFQPEETARMRSMVLKLFK